MERQQFESQSLKFKLERDQYKEENEHLTVENEKHKALYEELKKARRRRYYDILGAKA